MPHQRQPEPQTLPAPQAAPQAGRTGNATLAELKRTQGLEAQATLVSPPARGEDPGREDPAEGGRHGGGGMVEHGAHLAHRAHLAAEKGASVGETLEPLLEFAREEQASRSILEVHSKMAEDLRLMRRGVESLERAVSNGAGAKATAKLLDARTACANAHKAFLAEKDSVAKAGRFMAKYHAASAGPKGAALAAVGKAAARLESALEGSQIGRGLLSTGKLVTSEPFMQGLKVVAMALDGIDGYAESTATTTTGKVANGALAAGSTALLMSVPVVAGADMLAPKGYKPSEVLKGGAGAVTAIGEGVIAGDTRAMGAFHERSKAGEYGKVVQAASEAGDYWNEKGVGGGLSEFADAIRWWVSH